MDEPLDFANDESLKDEPFNSDISDSEMLSESHCPKSEKTTNSHVMAQFLLLDEANNSDDGSANSLSDNEIDEMLEQDLPPSKRLKTSQEKDKDDEAQIRYNKTVLDEKGTNHFEVLPNGWVTVTHSSGMPVYLHRESRVCTFGKPYFIGPGSARKHRVPISAIPCLAYTKALRTEKEQPDTLEVNGASLPNARVITAQENDEENQVSPEELQDYCKKRFLFKEIEVVRFNSWPARRRYEKKRIAEEQRPTLPEGSKLIMCPIKSKDGKNNRVREWIMNPNGKTYVCILHDYVQRALKEKPVYTFKELENAATPYMVTISINGLQYGTGVGASKKLAKMEAAKATLEILIPEMKEKIEEDSRMTGRAGESKKDDLSFFDAIQIEDPRVVEFCQKTTEPLPHTILLTCLQRNFGLSEPNIKYSMKTIKHSKNEFTMTVGEHKATVTCQSKRDGKQRASQAILQALHPHIKSWGSLLRLYGNHSVKSFKEKKVEEQEITALQSKGVTNGPNYAILNKLWEEMRKLREGRSNVKPIGVFVPPDDVAPPPSGSNLHTLQL